MNFFDALKWMRQRPGRECEARYIGITVRFRFNSDRPWGGQCETKAGDGTWTDLANVFGWMLDADWRPVEEPAKPKPCEHDYRELWGNNELIAKGCVICGDPYPGGKTAWTYTPSELGAKDRPTGEGNGISQTKPRNRDGKPIQELVADIVANPGGYPRTTRRVGQWIYQNVAGFGGPFDPIDKAARDLARTLRPGRHDLGGTA